MNCYPLKWKSLEGEGISEYKGDHPGKHSRPTGELHVYNKKKHYKEGEGWGACQKVKFNKMRAKRRMVETKGKKMPQMKLFLFISSTRQMANIILDDGYFATKSEKAAGR